MSCGQQLFTHQQLVTVPWGANHTSRETPSLISIYSYIYNISVLIRPDWEIDCIIYHIHTEAGAPYVHSCQFITTAVGGGSFGWCSTESGCLG